MAFVTWVRCVPIYQHDETYDDWENYDEPHDGWREKHEVRHGFRRHVKYNKMDRGKHVKYDIIFDTNERSCWEYKDALYENYENTIKVRYTNYDYEVE